MNYRVETFKFKPKDRKNGQKKIIDMDRKFGQEALDRKIRLVG